MSEFNYIRHNNFVYERVFVIDAKGDRKPTDKFVMMEKFPSISKAKHWSREQPVGAVRRYQTLEKEQGRQYMRSLFQ